MGEILQWKKLQYNAQINTNIVLEFLVLEHVIADRGLSYNTIRNVLFAISSYLLSTWSQTP